MKKFIWTCFVILFSASVSYAVTFADFKGFGFSVQGGLYAADSNFSKLTEIDYSTATKVMGYQATGKAPTYYGFDVFYERSGLFGFSEKSILGIKIGYHEYNGDKAKVTISDSGISQGVHSNTWSIESHSTAIPINVWYAYKTGKWKFSGGVGIEILQDKYTSKTLYEIYDIEGIVTGPGMWDFEIIHTNVNIINQQKDSKTETAIMPNINLGIEWNFIKFAGLFCDLGYRFNGKTSVGDFKEDLSGITFSVGIKAYPFNW
jgi:hypothetical protein